MVVFAGCKADETNKGKVLRVGVDDTYPPMEYRDKNNELVGFDVELAKAIGEKMGLEVEFVPTAWDGIQQGLNTENYDVIMSSLSITPDRLKSLEFSKPYLSNGQVIVVRPGDEAKSTKIEDLKGKKVGVQLQTTADTAVTKFEKEFNIEVTRYDQIVQTFDAMSAGYVDYIVVDLPVAIDYQLKQADKYKVTDTILTNEPIGVGIKKGNTELKDKVDKAIDELRSEGKLKELSEKLLKKDYTSDINENLDAIE